MEGRLHRAEALLRKFVPEIDLADPNMDRNMQQEFQNRQHARVNAANKMGAKTAPQPPANDPQLISMIDSIGQLDLDDRGDWDFHGNSSGVVFLNRMKDHFRGMLGPGTTGPFLPRSDQLASALNLDSPSPVGNSPFSSVSSIPELPPKEVASRLCYYSLSCATCLVRIVHAPSFYEKFERIYEMPLDNLSQEDTHFLGLLYSIMALGCMYHPFDSATPQSVGYKAAVEEGTKYYKIARGLIKEIGECRDLVSIQALLFMILFLQSTSHLSACYSFIGIALRSALRIGLHRQLQHAQMSPVEQEVRKRVFYVIRQMDIYVSTLLGFPLLLHSDDIDQPYPNEVDDEYLTNQGVMQPPVGTPSFFEAFNAHTRLMEVLGKITKYVYPTKAPAGVKTDKPASLPVSYSRIKEIEGDLQRWYERLPEAWRPTPEGPVEVVRVRHLLRFAYAHVQLVLYRPFLHYVSPRLCQGAKVDELSYACAAAAISVSRNIVHIGLEIRKQRVLSGPYWFMLYTEYFAVLSLIFYVIENPSKPGCGDVLSDARAGRQMIADVADKSMAADMLTTALNVSLLEPHLERLPANPDTQILFDQLPDALDQARSRGVPGRRSMATANSGSLNGMHSAAHVMSPRSEDLMRTHSGQMAARGYSIDSMAQSEHSFHDSGYMHDMLPVDVSSRATPDSTSTAASNNRLGFMAQSVNAHSGRNPVHKLDSLMFPSEDPFAYPNQPMMELGFQPSKDASNVTMAQDPGFFFQNSMEDVGDQLLGQPPPYMMAQGHQAPSPMNMGGNMYDPNSMVGLQHSSPAPQPAVAQRQVQQQRQPQPQAQPHPQAQPPQAQPQPQQQPQQRSGRTGLGAFFHRRQRAERQQERQIEQMFTEHGMQADFGSFFGSGRGGFQGM